MKRIPGKVPPFSLDYNGCPVALRFYPRKEITMSKQTPTVFEILAQQYRDWTTQIFGDDTTANDALETAQVATVDRAMPDLDLEPGDHILVWDRGTVRGPVGSKRVARLCGWCPALGIELAHDVQDFAHVIWSPEPEAAS